MRKLKRLLAAVMIILCFGSITAFAYEYSDIPEGTYEIKTELSCYVNAMGGVEFGAPLLTSAQLQVAADGSKTMTLYFTKSNVTIYSVTCDTFIDVSPSYVTETNGIESGTLGYYNEEGLLVTDDVTYTLSDDTAENAQNEQVHYVDSVSFPIQYESNTYSLSLFVNSNVMGTQFTEDGHAATLTVDWSSISADELPESDEVILENDSSEEPISNNENIENKDGLNIYHTDVDSEEDSKEETLTETSDTYIAYFKEPLLMAVGIIAGLMIIVGVTLVLNGKKEKN